MIELAEVTVKFTDGPEEVTALDRVSLTVRPGEFVVLHGPSGSGKSTLLNVLAGLRRFDEGSARVDGQHIKNFSERKLAELRLQSIGVVFQENNLIPELTAAENVQLPLSAMGFNRNARAAEAARVLEAVGLHNLFDRRPSRLSGGQRQRVGIARAIAGKKSYLLADEPTGALDTRTSQQIFALLRAFADHGVGVVVASHDPNVLSWADREVELIDGTLVADNYVSSAPARI